MKNVPIKFRIKSDDGKYIYLTPSLNGDYDQLVGYDADGNEVYEGDKLKFCGNPEIYRYVPAYYEARITAGLESSDLPLSEYKLTSEDEFYNWQYNIHTDNYE